MKKAVKILITENAGLKGLSFIVAAFLWFMIVGRKEMVYTKEIPVKFRVPADMQVVNSDSVMVEIRAVGTVFKLALVDRTDKIYVDFTKAKEGTQNVHITQDTLRVPYGVRVLSIVPAEFPVELKKVESINGKK